ncbi:MAG: serine/threonine-protein kinase [Candidatus Eisenbacteria bacterium]|nr:serine/threonine-protein kinase [Candidatus Eisenbacteria bacterium]
MVGKTISHYKILDKIGEGGMGVVYKAEDTRLDRTVALKFLASHLLESDEARERFVREAKAAATLDHPNICTVHEIDEADGETFLAMAYIEGPTLKEKIDERPLKLKQALDIAIEIAEGLAAAHERGINHRDIKPANVMLGSDGHVKIMDFGLAHLGGKTKITKSGVVLGTPSYMAPEQVRGEETDRRTDIWAFGVVLHEMITGQPPFGGETDESLSYAVLHVEPEPLTALRSGVPVELDRVVSKLLAKDPDERYQHIDEALVDLRTLRKRLPETTRTRTTAAPAPVAAARQARLPWALFAIATFVALAVTLAHFRQSPIEAPLRKFAVAPEQSLFITTYNTDVVISPDGRHIVYTGGQRPWIQDLDQERPRRMEAVGERAFEPFWSPDSSSIGFFQDTQLRTARISGGAPTTICNLSGEFWGGAWSQDGEVIVFAAGSPPKLYEVAASGGEPRLILAPAEPGAASGEPTEAVYSPHSLPEEAGARVLLFVSGPQNEPVMMVQDFESGRRETLGIGALPWYSPSGHVVYQETGLAYNLWALPFSLDTLKSTGRPFRVTTDGRYATIARDGTMVYTQVASRKQQLIWLDRHGRRMGNVGGPRGLLFSPRLSPDDRDLALVGGEDWNYRDLWVHDIGRGSENRLTAASEGLYNVSGAEWSPAGDRIAFTVRDQGILVRDVNGGEPPQRFQASGEITDWSRDGRYILMTVTNSGTSLDLSYLELSEDGKNRQAHPFLSGAFREISGKLSPDGRFAAYVSDESGQWEIYVRPFPRGDGKWLVSSDGGSQPLWSRDGKELFYLQEDGALVVVPVSLDPTFSPGPASELFRVQGVTDYDVSSDGQRFIVAEPVGEAPPPAIRVVQNWYSEFRDRE